MRFELTKEFISEIRENIKEGYEKRIHELVDDLHPADVAEIFDHLERDEIKYMHNILGKELFSAVLVELEESVREEVLTSLTAEEIARQLDEMESDDAADVMADLSDALKEEVIAQIEDVEQASDIVDLLSYDEDSAGGLMAKEFIKANISWDVTTCVREMRKQAKDVEHVYTVYVVDDYDKLLGTLSLKQLLLAATNRKVENLCNKEVISVKASMKSEEVAALMEKYDLVVLPVVDGLGRLIGRITIDDVVDVIREEAVKDYQLASGISDNVEFSDNIITLTKARIPWLLIGLVGGICGSMIIGKFEEQIKIYPEMAFFIPLITAMGGNVGVQASAIIVQGLASQTLGHDNWTSRIFKEFSVALVNGLVCSFLLLAYTFFSGDSYNLSLTVSIALLVVIIFAGIFGTFVPLFLNRFKIDPALATGPFITTANDIIGLFMYFMIGRLMYTML